MFICNSKQICAEGGNLMEFQTQKYTNTIDLSSNNDLSKKQAGNNIIHMIKPHIDAIINAVFADNFNYNAFPFSKTLSSNLTGKNGLYLIINKKTKRIYLGSASNLAQRKGDHKRTFSGTSKKLARAMRDDLMSGSVADFYFVPLVVIENLGLDNTQVSLFFDTYVEQPLLADYLFNLPNVFYNIKTVGPFMEGNAFGGRPNSGSPSQPVSYTTIINGQSVTCAWESVSAAANTFKVSTKLIRTKVEQGKMVKLNTTEYECFTGIKISNQEAQKGQKKIELALYNQILLELFPNVANRHK